MHDIFQSLARLSRQATEEDPEQTLTALYELIQKAYKTGSFSLKDFPHLFEVYEIREIFRIDCSSLLEQLNHDHVLEDRSTARRILSAISREILDAGSLEARFHRLGGNYAIVGLACIIDSGISDAWQARVKALPDELLTILVDDIVGRLRPEDTSAAARFETARYRTKCKPRKRPLPERRYLPYEQDKTTNKADFGLRILPPPTDSRLGTTTVPEVSQLVTTTGHSSHPQPSSVPALSTVSTLETTSNQNVSIISKRSHGYDDLMKGNDSSSRKGRCEDHSLGVSLPRIELLDGHNISMAPQVQNDHQDTRSWRCGDDSPIVILPRPKVLCGLSLYPGLSGGSASEILASSIMTTKGIYPEEGNGYQNTRSGSTVAPTAGSQPVSTLPTVSTLETTIHSVRDGNQNVLIVGERRDGYNLMKGNENDRVSPKRLCGNHGLVPDPGAL